MLTLLLVLCSVSALAAERVSLPEGATLEWERGSEACIDAADLAARVTRQMAGAEPKAASGLVIHGKIVSEGGIAFSATIFARDAHAAYFGERQIKAQTDCRKRLCPRPSCFHPEGCRRKLRQAGTTIGGRAGVKILATM